MDVANGRRNKYSQMIGKNAARAASLLAAAIFVALQGQAWAAVVPIAALGVRIDLPAGWRVAQEAGERGCSLVTPDGSRVEVVTWELASANKTATAAADEHLILLFRGFGFRVTSRQPSEGPQGQPAVAVAGMARVDGDVWSGYFLAFVLPSGRGCVVGSFVEGAGQQAQARRLVQELCQRLARPKLPAPVLAYLPVALRAGHERLAAVPTLAAASAVRLASQPARRLAPSALKARLAYCLPSVEAAGMVLACTTAQIAAGAGRGPILARSAAPGRRPAVALVAIAPPAIAASRPAVNARAFGGAAVEWTAGGTTAVTAEASVTRVASLPGSRPITQIAAAEAAGAPLQLSARRTLVALAPRAGEWRSQPAASRPTRQRAQPPVVAAVPAVPTGGQVATPSRAQGPQALGSERVTPPPARPGATAVRPRPEIAAAPAGPVARPTGPAVGSAAGRAAGAGAVSSERVSRPAEPAVVAGVDARQPRIAAAPAESTVRPSGPRIRGARQAAALPERSAPTAGVVRDAETGALAIIVPVGWAVTAHVYDTPAGPAIFVSGVNAQDPSARFWWAQPVRETYRDYTQLLRALGYREWQRYKDSATGHVFTVAKKRGPVRFLEDIVLPHAGDGLAGWEVIDTRPSDKVAGMLPRGSGAVVHLLGYTPRGSCDCWYAVATGHVEGQPSHVWVGAWLGARQRPGDRRAIDALAAVVQSCRVSRPPAEAGEVLRMMVDSAKAAIADLLAAVPAH